MSEMDLPTALASQRTQGIARLTQGYKGEMKTVFRSGVAEMIHETEDAEPMEFSHFNFNDRGTDGRAPRMKSFVVGLVDPGTGRLKGSRAAATFIRDLPPAAVLQTYHSGREFERVFGPFRATAAESGPPGDRRSSVDWMAFTPAPDGAVRVTSVFLFTLRRRVSASQTEDSVEGMVIQEGVFRPTGCPPRPEPYPPDQTRAGR